MTRGSRAATLHAFQRSAKEKPGLGPFGSWVVSLAIAGGWGVRYLDPSIRQLSKAESRHESVGGERRLKPKRRNLGPRLGFAKSGGICHLPSG